MDQFNRSIGTRNVTPRKIGMERLQARNLFAGDVSFVDGIIAIEGTDAADVAHVYAEESTVTVSFGSGDAAGLITEFESFSFNSEDVQKIVFDGHAGDDTLVNDTNLPTIARGGIGDDVLMGGTGDDVLAAGPGDDVVLGGGGDDLVLASPGADVQMHPSRDDGSNGPGSELPVTTGDNVAALSISEADIDPSGRESDSSEPIESAEDATEPVDDGESHEEPICGTATADEVSDVVDVPGGDLLTSQPANEDETEPATESGELATLQPVDDGDQPSPEQDLTLELSLEEGGSSLSDESAGVIDGDDIPVSPSLPAIDPLDELPGSEMSDTTSEDGFQPDPSDCEAEKTTVGEPTASTDPVSGSVLIEDASDDPGTLEAVEGELADDEMNPDEPVDEMDESSDNELAPSDEETAEPQEPLEEISDESVVPDEGESESDEQPATEDLSGEGELPASESSDEILPPTTDHDPQIDPEVGMDESKPGICDEPLDPLEPGDCGNGSEEFGNTSGDGTTTEELDHSASPLQETLTHVSAEIPETLPLVESTEPTSESDPQAGTMSEDCASDLGNRQTRRHRPLRRGGGRHDSFFSELGSGFDRPAGSLASSDCFLDQGLFNILIGCQLGQFWR